MIISFKSTKSIDLCSPGYLILSMYFFTFCSSSELVINNKIINTPVAGGRYGLRDMSTFWVVKE